MPRSSRALAGVLALAALAACGESTRPSSDVGTVTDGPASTYGTPSVSCDIFGAKELASLYLAGSDASTARDLLFSMLSTGAPTDASTRIGYKVLRIVAAATDAGRQIGTPEKGSALVNATLACMKVAVSGSTDFAPALAPGGGFGVRGGAGDPTTPVTTRDRLSGVQAPNDDFATWMSGEVLLYGSEVPDGQTQEQLIGRVFDWSTVRPLPAPALVGRGVVGICSGLTDADRIEQNGAAGVVVLPFAEPTFLNCSTTAQADAAPVGLLASARRAFGRLFLPAPLQAAAAVKGTGGTAGSFSQFGVVTAGQVNPTIESLQPNDGFTDTPIQPTFVISAAGNGGTAIEGVSATVRAVLNNGRYVEVSGGTGVTDASGTISFPNLTINKPGGYQLEVTLRLDGYPDVVVRSGKFNLKRAR